MNVHQVELAQFTDTSQWRMVVWIDASLALRVGHTVIGKDGERWQVLHVYPNMLIDISTIHSDWKVGGLM